MPDIPVGCEMTRHWAVSVQAEGTDILTISDGYLAGVADIQPWASTIRGCAQHLIAFIGPTARATNIDGIAFDVAREIKALDPIAMRGGHDAHLVAIKALVADGIRAVIEAEERK